MWLLTVRGCGTRWSGWTSARIAELAREINVALPFEMTDTERFNLVTSFVKEHFVSRGMVADIAWHGPPEDGDKRTMPTLC